MEESVHWLLPRDTLDNFHFQPEGPSKESSVGVQSPELFTSLASRGLAEQPRTERAGDQWCPLWDERGHGSNGIVFPRHCSFQIQETRFEKH